MPRGSRPGERRGGRSAGTPNKKTVLAASVREALEARGADPVEVVVDIMAGKIVMNADVRLRAAGTLMEYVYAKRIRTEVSGADGGQLDLFAGAGERIAGKLDSIAARIAGGAAGGPDAGRVSGA